MASVKTEVTSRINGIKSRANFTHCHSKPLELTVGGTVKAMQVMRGSLTQHLS